MVWEKIVTVLEAPQVLVPAPKLVDGFPVAVNTLHRLDITPEDSIGTLRTKVAAYAEKTDAEILHVINRYFNGFKGENSSDKGLTILPVGTYMVDIVDHLSWDAGDFGDQHSCYWQGYTGERRRMGQEGTWGFRVHYSPKHRNYNADTVDHHVAALQEAYPNILWHDSRTDGSRAFFVPWWRLAERPGAALEEQDGEGVQPDGNRRRGDRWGHRPANQRIVPATNEPGWQQAFGGRWTGDRRTGIMHNPYGSLHLPQLAGLFTKLTGLLPNDVSPGIATFGDIKPHEYDWIFNRADYQYNRHRQPGRSFCENCRKDTSFTANRPMKIQRVNGDGEKYGPAILSGVWCIDCITIHAKRSPKSDRWTRTRGVKWYA